MMHSYLYELDKSDYCIMDDNYMQSKTITAVSLDTLLNCYVTLLCTCISICTVI